MGDLPQYINRDYMGLYKACTGLRAKHPQYWRIRWKRTWNMNRELGLYMVFCRDPYLEECKQDVTMGPSSSLAHGVLV